MGAAESFEDFVSDAVFIFPIHILSCGIVFIGWPSFIAAAYSTISSTPLRPLLTSPAFWGTAITLQICLMYFMEFYLNAMRYLLYPLHKVLILKEMTSALNYCGDEPLFYRDVSGYDNLTHMWNEIYDEVKAKKQDGGEDARRWAETVRKFRKGMMTRIPKLMKKLEEEENLKVCF